MLQLVATPPGVSGPACAYESFPTGLEHAWFLCSSLQPKAGWPRLARISFEDREQQILLTILLLACVLVVLCLMDVIGSVLDGPPCSSGWVRPFAGTWKEVSSGYKEQHTPCGKKEKVGVKVVKLKGEFKNGEAGSAS
jgi:hypothetical protein